MVIGVSLSGSFAKYSELSVCAYCKYSLCIYIITIVSHLRALFPIVKVATAHK